MLKKSCAEYSDIGKQYILYIRRHQPLFKSFWETLNLTFIVPQLIDV